MKIQMSCGTTAMSMLSAPMRIRQTVNAVQCCFRTFPISDEVKEKWGIDEYESYVANATQVTTNANLKMNFCKKTRSTIVFR